MRIFVYKYTTTGVHVTVNVFASTAYANTLVRLGQLIMRDDEWAQFQTNHDFAVLHDRVRFVEVPA